jgi:hypothetical protein
VCGLGVNVCVDVWTLKLGFAVSAFFALNTLSFLTLYFHSFTHSHKRCSTFQSHTQFLTLHPHSRPACTIICHYVYHYMMIEKIIYDSCVCELCDLHACSLALNDNVSLHAQPSLCLRALRPSRMLTGIIRQCKPACAAFPVFMSFATFTHTHWH